MIRVLTYNIHHGEGLDGQIDLERIIGIIGASRPDVVCLQEVDRKQPRSRGLDMPAVFAERLGMTPVYGPNLEFDGGEYGNLILTRLPIVNSENRRLPGPEGAEPRGILRVTVKACDETLDVFNTHFGLKGEERKLQAESALSGLADRPALLAGDLNEDTDGGGLKRLLERLNDSMGESGSPQTSAHSFPADRPRKRIDFVLTTPGIVANGGSFIRTASTAVASDHLPYVVELTLPPPLAKRPAAP